MSAPALAAAAAPAWHFDAELAVDGRTLAVSACSQQALTSARFRAGSDAGAWLRSAQRSSGAPLSTSANALDAIDWRAGECLLTQIDVDRAAAEGRRGQSQRPGHYLRLSASRWLWRPARLDPDSSLGFSLPEGWSASVPWRRLPDGRHRLGSTPDRWPAVTAFGRFTEHRVALGGGQLRISVLPTSDSINEASILDWLRDVAAQLVLLDSRLRPADTQVLVEPLPDVDAAVPWGEITRGGGSSVHLYIGLRAGPERWRADWTASHEFAHLLHPFLGDAGRWLSEGLASYYQNVLRARSGELSATVAWQKLRQGFERGRSASLTDDRSLQQVATGRVRAATMRVYWAGAAFWLETDRQLRAQGDSLDALLARFAERHGDTECCWTPAEFIDALHTLAPATGLRQRHATYAASREFPLARAQLDAWELELAQPGSRLAEILAIHPSVEAVHVTTKLEHASPRQSEPQRARRIASVLKSRCGAGLACPGMPHIEREPP